MRHDKFRTVLRSTVGAVILMPALAFAQSNSSSPSGQGTQGSATQGSATQGSGSQPSGAQGKKDTGAQGSTGTQGSSSRGTTGQGSHSTGSQSTGSQPSGSSAAGSDMPSDMQAKPGASAARQSIDPAEVQRVFGSDATVVDLQTLGPDQIRAVQQSLQERGHYKGTIDGVYGPQTRAAVKAMLSQQYSLNQRLINQGQVTGPLAASIGIQRSDISPVGGTDTVTGQQEPRMNRTQPATRQGGSQPSGTSTGSPSGTSGSGSAGSSGSSTGSGADYPR